MELSLTLIVAITNMALAIGGLAVNLWGVHHFKSGVIIHTLRRGQVAAVFLLIHFVAVALAVMDITPYTGIEDVSGLGFMLALAYVTYGFVNDWQHLERFAEK